MRRFGDQKKQPEELFGAWETTESGAADTSGEEEAGLDLLELYLEELRAVPQLSVQEEAELTGRAAMGEEHAKQRLTEGYLMYALTLVKDYMGGPLSVSELIAVANLALVQAVSRYLANAVTSAKNTEGELESAVLRDTITAEVEAALKHSCGEAQSSGQEEQAIAERLNRLTEISRVMATELGRQATESELAERMRSTEEEIRELVKMSMQAL